MTHDELLTIINEECATIYEDACGNVVMSPYALRAVVELTSQPLDTTDTPAEEVAWYSYGYNLAMAKVFEAIEKELK